MIASSQSCRTVSAASSHEVENIWQKTQSRQIIIIINNDMYEVVLISPPVLTYILIPLQLSCGSD